jgi:SOS response regulatory protein OraA/RecX
VIVVTALRSAGRGRVVVELDGSPWRTLPLEAVVRAGLVAGGELDRERARTLAVERRRLGALAVANQSLSRRDRSEHELRERLEAGGVRPAERDDAVGVLERAGLVDDTRFAISRATALAGRGYGDAAIRSDLEQRGVEGGAVEAALGSLEPERERAVREAERLGGGVRAARALARRGFDLEALDWVVADDER